MIRRSFFWRKIFSHNFYFYQHIWGWTIKFWDSKNIRVSFVSYFTLKSRCHRSKITELHLIFECLKCQTLQNSETSPYKSHSASYKINLEIKNFLWTPPFCHIISYHSHLLWTKKFMHGTLKSLLNSFPFSNCLSLRWISKRMFSLSAERRSEKSRADKLCFMVLECREEVDIVTYLNDIRGNNFFTQILLNNSEHRIEMEENRKSSLTP